MCHFLFSKRGTFGLIYILKSPNRVETYICQQEYSFLEISVTSFVIDLVDYWRLVRWKEQQRTPSLLVEKENQYWHSKRMARATLIDLQGNVILITPQNDSLFADQLYYDQKQEWLFTNQEVRLKSVTANNANGNIFDSDTKFKNYTILDGSGDMLLRED